MPTRRTSDIPEVIKRADAPRSGTRASKASVPVPARMALSAEARRAMIAENAYLRAERRGFTPGHESEDWLAAEAEVDAVLKADFAGSSQ